MRVARAVALAVGGDAQGVIADLSRGGCRMAIDVRGQQGLRQTVVENIIVLCVPLNSDGIPLSVTATVRCVDMDLNRHAARPCLYGGEQGILDRARDLPHHRVSSGVSGNASTPD